MRLGLEKFAKRNINTLEIAKTVIGIDRIILWGKLPTTITVEGYQLLEGKIENLETLKRKSENYISLEPLHSIKIAESSFLGLHRTIGLTDFGRES